MPPLVSIIIPAYNYAHFLPYTIENILTTQEVEAEIIIVDDGSTDNTREVVAGLGDAVRYIHQKNKGVSAARNTGIDHIRGEFVVFLDADDFFYPGTLRAQCQTLQDNPEAHAAMCFNQCVISQSPTGPFVPSNIYPPVKADFAVHLCRANLAPIHAFMIRSDLVKNVGYFDEKKKYLEDYDFFLRCAASGCNFVASKTGIALYRQHEHSASADTLIMKVHEATMRMKINSALLHNKEFPDGKRVEGWLAHADRCLSIATSFTKTKREIMREMINLSVFCLKSIEKEIKGIKYIPEENDKELFYFFAIPIIGYFYFLSKYFFEKSIFGIKFLTDTFPTLKRTNDELMALYNESLTKIHVPSLYVIDFENWETTWMTKYIDQLIAK